MALTPGYPDCTLSLELLATSLRNFESGGAALSNNVAVTKSVDYTAESSTISLVTGVTNTDTKVFSLPQGTGRYLVTGALILFTTTPVAGSGLTQTVYSLGLTAGAAEWIAAQTVLAANFGTTTATGQAFGLTVAQLGTSLPAAAGNRAIVDTTSADVNFFFRQANTGGAVGVTAGACKVFVFYEKLALEVFHG
jgi:hypothetical protein